MDRQTQTRLVVSFRPAIAPEYFNTVSVKLGTAKNNLWLYAIKEFISCSCLVNILIMLSTVFLISCIKMTLHVQCTKPTRRDDGQISGTSFCKQTELCTPSGWSCMFLAKLMVTHLDKLENCNWVH